MNKAILRDFLVGVTALLGLAGLIVMLMLVGELDKFTERQYQFHVTLTNAAGLTTTSPVTLNGVRVGQVDETKVRQPPNVGAELTLRIKHGTQIPRACKLSINSSLVGDASLEFTIPAGASGLALQDMIKPDDVYDGGTPTNMMDRLEAVISKPMERLTTTADKIDKLADTYTEVGHRLNELLEPRTPADVAAGKPPNLRSTLARLDSALAGADAWLSDAELRQQAKDAVAKADRILGQADGLVTSLKEMAGKVDTSMTKAADRLDDIGKQALTMLRKAEDAAATLAGTLETATKGQGTFGQLMQNPDLYNSMRDAAQRLDKALTEFQLLVEKYKAEGIPIKL